MKKHIQFDLGKYNTIHAVINFAKQRSQGLILFIPGYTARKEWLFYSYMAKKLSQQGYDVLRFDLPGHGKSGGQKNETTINDIMEIVKLLVQNIKNNDIVPIDELILAGHSYGGIVAMMASSQIEEVKGVIAISASLDWKKVINSLMERGRMKKLKENLYFVQLGGFLWQKCNPNLKEYAENFDIKPWIKKIKKPVLVISGTRDRTILTKLAQETYEKLDCPKVFEKIDGAMHWFTLPHHRKKLMDAITNWLNKHS